MVAMLQYRTQRLTMVRTVVWHLMNALLSKGTLNTMVEDYIWKQSWGQIALPWNILVQVGQYWHLLLWISPVIQIKTVGAGFYLQVHENPFLSAAASIHFSFCIFKGNLAYSAQGGTAAHVVNYHLPGSVKHQIPQYNIVFDECLFVRNGHLTTKDHVQLLGYGTLYIAENALTLVKDS